ncbi:(Fe-S)-binding protein [Vulcanisaeta distributa]|uniref:(Fe-S)-binding protein n=1 Tax=Vulcanisaeta distributa TaxID=164451 RepID=UPI000A8A25B5|nr:(Fe-S)-binding protein [Vulcanisaeta distributa]
MTTHNIKNSPLGRIALARSLMRGPVNEKSINEAYTYFWQCLTCRRCAWVCPFGVDVADISRTIRSLLYEIGLAPPNYVAGVINNLESTGNFLGLPEDVIKEIILNVVDQIKLEKGVNVKVKVNEPAYAMLLPSACADYTVAVNTLKGYILLLNELGIDFTLSTRAPDITNYGLFMDERHMRLIAERIVEESRRLSVKLVIAGECGHGWRVFKNYVIPRLREYGIEGTHILYIAANAIRRGLIKLDTLVNGDLTYIYMDPCHYARGGGDLVKEPRFILSNTVMHYVELNDRPELAICCGGTSGMLAKEMEELSIKYAELWYLKAINKGADCVVVPCAACKLQMDRVLPRLNKLHNHELTFTGLMDLVYKAMIPKAAKT